MSCKDSIWLRQTPIKAETAVLSVSLWPDPSEGRNSSLVGRSVQATGPAPLTLHVSTACICLPYATHACACTIHIQSSVPPHSHNSYSFDTELSIPLHSHNWLPYPVYPPYIVLIQSSVPLHSHKVSAEDYTSLAPTELNSDCADTTGRPLALRRERKKAACISALRLHPVTQPLHQHCPQLTCGVFKMSGSSYSPPTIHVALQSPQTPAWETQPWPDNDGQDDEVLTW